MLYWWLVSMINVLILYPDDNIDTLIAAWCVRCKYTNKISCNIKTNNTVIDYPCVIDSVQCVPIKNPEKWHHNKPKLNGEIMIIIGYSVPLAHLPYIAQAVKSLKLIGYPMEISPKISCDSYMNPLQTYCEMAWHTMFPDEHQCPDFINIISEFINDEGKGRYSSPLMTGLMFYVDVDFKTFDLLYEEGDVYIPRLSKLGEYIINIMEKVICEIITKSHSITFMNTPAYIIESTTMRPELSIYLADYKQSLMSIVWWYNFKSNTYKLLIRRSINSTINLLQLLHKFNPTGDVDLVSIVIDARNQTIADFIQDNKYSSPQSNNENTSQNNQSQPTNTPQPAIELYPENAYGSRLNLSNAPINPQHQMYSPE